MGSRDMVCGPCACACVTLCLVVPGGRGILLAEGKSRSEADSWDRADQQGPFGWMKRVRVGVVIPVCFRIREARK